MSSPNGVPDRNHRWRLGAIALVALALTGLLWLWSHPASQYLYRVEVVIETGSTGFTQLYFDRGPGLSESDSSTQPLSAGVNSVRLSLPAGSIRALRFDPINGPGRTKFGALRIVHPNGEIVRVIPPGALSPAHQIAEVHEDAGMLAVATTPAADDPQFSLTFQPPLELPSLWLSRLNDTRFWLVSRYLIVLLACGLVQNTWRCRASRIAAFKAFARLRPRLALATCAALAAVLSSYPVVFFGRSFVSPNTTALLYNHFPSVPGYGDARAEDARGADVGAMLWQHYSYTMQAHRALAAGEVPLWNRFVGCGVTLFGQGQSMIGDPLHLLVVLTNGASWAFDLKFILAKALFACGLGWCVWALTRDFPAAAISTLSGAFIAFFNYRLNHPSIFTIGYAPWILVAWFQLRDARDGRGFRHGLAGWFLANWMVIASGTVKEAYLLALSLNVTGALIFFTTPRPWQGLLRRAVILAVAAIAFVLFSAPLWRTFLAALKTSYTSYDLPSFVQLPGQWLIGLFDDIFYREFTPWHYVYKPAANFLVLLGCLWAVLQPRRLMMARAPLIVLCGALVALLLAFHFGPPAWAPHWVLAIPLLRNVVNLDTIFSYIAIVHLGVLAGWGFFAARAPLRAGQAGRHGWMMLTILAGLFAAYFFLRSDNFAASHTWPKWADATQETVLLYVAVVLLPLAAWTLTLLAARRLRTGKLNTPGLLVAVIALAVLIGRHGQHLRGIPTTYVAAPGPRADLQALSPVVETLRERTAREPGRVLGLEQCLFPGFASSYGLEFIFGANALDNRWYRQFAEAAGLVLPKRWIFETATADLPKWRPFADFLNVRYLVAPAGTKFPTDGFHQVASLDLDVFASEHPWPRAFFTNQVERYDGPAELVERIRTRAGQGPFAAFQAGEEFSPAIRTALDQLARQSPAAAVPAHDYELGTNQTSFTIDVPGAGIAVLHETWLPEDFVASVNGVVVPYLRINHAFKGVLLPAAGTHRIEFTYRPHDLNTSLALSGIGFLLLLGSFLAARSLGPETAADPPSASAFAPEAADAPRLDEAFYRSKFWGSLPIQTARDLPSLKLRYVMEMLAQRTEPQTRLLEVGCGSGRILASLHQRDPALRLTGIDLSAEQIQLAQRSHPGIEFVCGNGEALPFPDASFDYVVFFDYLEHIERPARSLAEIFRVLKPGGCLHLVCPAERQSIYGWSSKIFRRHFKKSTAGHIQQFTRRELERLVGAAGFRVSDRHYSYHLLGSLMDYALFTLMLHPRIYAAYWSGNPYYATGTAPDRRGFFQSVLRLGNAVAYHESKWLSRVATFATAVHLTAEKPHEPRS